VLALLLARFPDEIQRRNAAGKTLLQVLVEFNQYQCLDQVLRMSTSSYDECLLEAIQLDSPECVRALVSFKELSTKNLQRAIECARGECLEYLTQYHKTHPRKSPTKHFQPVKILLEKTRRLIHS